MDSSTSGESEDGSEYDPPGLQAAVMKLPKGGENGDFGALGSLPATTTRQLCQG